MDAILFRDLRVEASIGIHKRERHVRQTLSIDLDIGLPGKTVFSSDKVAAPISRTAYANSGEPNKSRIEKKPLPDWEIARWIDGL